MLYTPSHAELAQHPKTRKLARLLGVSIPAAIGHLHLLWHFALKYAPDGCLARFDFDEIADGCMWEGDGAHLTGALFEAGWTDMASNGDRTIHDWEEYGGKALKQKEQAAERQQRWRDRNKTDTSPPPNERVTVTSPSRNALDKKIEEEKKEEERIPTPLTPQAEPPTQAVGGGATAPRRPAAPRPVRNVPKPKDQPAPINPWWDALVAGIGFTPATESERQVYGKAVRELRGLNASPDDILVRCGHFRERWPNVELTAPALLKHWSRMEHAPPPSARAPTGRRPTVEEANLALQRQYEAQENGHEPGNFPEVIDADWYSDEQGTQPRPLRPVVAQVRGAPR